MTNFCKEYEFEKKITQGENKREENSFRTCESILISQKFL